MRASMFWAAIVVTLAPFGCGGDDDGDTGGKSGGGGTGGGSGGSGGSSGSATGGNAGTGTAGTAGTSTGGSAGTGGTAGSATGGAAGSASDGGPTNPISEICKACLQQNCQPEVQACQTNDGCNACVNQDYTAPACDTNNHFQDLCTCGVTGGGPCHNECGSFC